MLAPMTFLRLVTVIALIAGTAALPARAQFPFQNQPPPAPRPYVPRTQPRLPAQPPLPGQPFQTAPAPPGQANRGPPGTLPQVAPPAPEVPTPYDHDLQRLSEILGALHFLRGICDANDGQKWRNEAQALIDAEAPNGDRHDQMVASFNRGYRGFQQSYHSCTPAANMAIRRYLEEGAKIAREITARYAN